MASLKREREESGEARRRALRAKTATRRLHRDLFAAARPIELAFLLQDWADAYNVGSLFRVADACGAREVILTMSTPAPPNPMISVTSLGHHRRVPFRSFPTNEEGIAYARERGYALVAVEITEEAAPFQEFDYPSRTCLVLGHEQRGIYGKVLRACDAVVVIPMAGKGRSLNVHVAGAVVAFYALFGKSEPR